jgi:hypothetical protein
MPWDSTLAKILQEVDFRLRVAAQQGSCQMAELCHRVTRRGADLRRDTTHLMLAQKASR